MKKNMRNRNMKKVFDFTYYIRTVDQKGSRVIGVCVSFKAKDAKSIMANDSLFKLSSMLLLNHIFPTLWQGDHFPCKFDVINCAIHLNID